MPTPPPHGDDSAADSASSNSPNSSGTAGPQPGPTPSYQQYRPPQPGTQGGSTRGFFNSLRGSGLLRMNDRWIAGVAGGIAYRFGLDPVLVRCVLVVLTIFSGVGLVLYGVAWALLPEESDGRIHLEEALSGRFSAGLAGACGATVVGMSSLGNGFIPSWYVGLWGIPGIAAPVWTLFWLGLTALAVIGAFRFAQNRRQGRHTPQGPQKPQPWQTAQHSAAQAPGARPGGQDRQAHPTSTASDSSTAGTAPAFGPSTSAFERPVNGPAWQNRPRQPYQPAPMPVHPPRPRRPGPGSSVSLAVLGLGILAVASVWYATVNHHLGLLQGQFILIGTLVALLGAGILISGLRRRNGGWMTVLGWPALFLLAIPALMVASVTPTNLARMPFWTITESANFTSTTVTWKELSSSANSGSVTHSKNIGDVILDLRGMPADEADRLSTINAHLDLGRLLVKTDDDQPVTVKADVGMGSVESRVSQAWTVNNRQMYHDNDDEAPTTYDVNGRTFPTYSDVNGGLNVKSTLTSPSKEDGRPTITINAAVSIGSISVEELSDGVSWYGNAKESVWIVSSWSDERGNAHRGYLPVPGMTHQAITADNAEACIRSAHASENADDRSSGVTWHDLSDLTSKERTSYDACVQKALAGQSAAEPSANPTGETTPSPSQAPTDAG